MRRWPRELTLHTLLADPLTRLVMDSDGVSPEDTLRAFLVAARSGRPRTPTPHPAHAHQTRRGFPKATRHRGGA